jgi:hypothetical protein
MELRDVTVDLDAMRQLGELANNLSDVGSQLLLGKTEEQQAAGNQVWRIADKMDALLHNCMLPFDVGNALPPASDRTSAET